jgi:hypothetical protein
MKVESFVSWKLMRKLQFKKFRDGQNRIQSKTTNITLALGGIKDLRMMILFL